MVDGLEKLESAARDFDLLVDDDFVDPSRLAAVIDRLQGKLCKVVNRARQRGDHLGSAGITFWSGRAPAPGSPAPARSLRRRLPTVSASASSWSRCLESIRRSGQARSATRRPR